MVSLLCINQEGLFQLEYESHQLHGISATSFVTQQLHLNPRQSLCNDRMTFTRYSGLLRGRVNEGKISRMRLIQLLQAQLECYP